eukprot:1746406-Rhodomonas_salina.1
MALHIGLYWLGYGATRRLTTASTGLGMALHVRLHWPGYGASRRLGAGKKTDRPGQRTCGGARRGARP